MLSKILLLGFGGFVGSNIRYWVGQIVIKQFGNNFPLGTLIVNALGSFLLGLLIFGINDAAKLSPNIRLLLGVGLLGAFTTFSTFSVDTIQFIKDSNYYSALLNIFFNITVSLIAAALGLFCATKTL